MFLRGKKHWISTCKKIKTKSTSPTVQVSSNWSKDLKVWNSWRQILKEVMSDTGCSENIKKTPMVQEGTPRIRRKKDKRIKMFCKSQGKVQQSENRTCRVGGNQTGSLYDNDKNLNKQSNILINK